MEKTSNKVQFTNQEWTEMHWERANEILSPMKPLERLKILETAPPTMLPYEHWIKKSKAQLIYWYMNAKKTCSCGGHYKGSRNEQLVKEYLALMGEYSVPIPPDEVCYVLGQFNGEGSY